MDKDLKDAVLAAFDGEPEDGKTAPAPATPEAAGATVVSTPAAEPKPGNAAKKTALAAGAGRRAPLAGGAPAARPSVPARAAADLPAATAAPRASVTGILALLLSAVLVVLVAVLLAQTLSLKEAVARQDLALRDLRNLARITVSVYQEPGKRPQQVIAGHDVDADGKVKIGKMLIQPLPEE